MQLHRRGKHPKIGSFFLALRVKRPIALLFVSLAVIVWVASGSKHLSPSPVPAAEAGTFDVVSLNMAKERNVSTILRDLNANPRVRTADILLLQEVASDPGGPSVADQIAAKLGYSLFFAPAGPQTYDQGLAILSRFPVSDSAVLPLKTYDLRFHSRRRFAISATADTPAGSVRIWDTHLDTRLNARQRADQLEPVIRDASRVSGPRLIGGDFNTNEFNWIGHVIPSFGGPSHAGAIRREMLSHGFLTPFADNLITFPAYRRHLDWIFGSNVHAVDSTVEPMLFSDHNAISARFSIY
jgi:endonuclease/exonuclease/phosphatase family metal-dependent hydrolase